MRLNVDKSQQNKKISIIGSVRILKQRTRWLKFESKLFAKCNDGECAPHDWNHNFSYGDTPFR